MGQQSRGCGVVKRARAFADGVPPRQQPRERQDAAMHCGTARTSKPRQPTCLFALTLFCEVGNRAAVKPTYHASGALADEEGSKAVERGGVVGPAVESEPPVLWRIRRCPRIAPYTHSKLESVRQHHNVVARGRCWNGTACQGARRRARAHDGIGMARNS